MLLRLDSSQLLEYRRELAGLEPLYLDFTLERTDGIDVDHLINARLRNWYLQQLDSAPTMWLPVEDVTENTTVEAGSGTDCSRVVLPENVRRPVSVQMSGWKTATPVLAPAYFDRVVHLQQNRFTAASAYYPIAVADPSTLNGVLVFPSCKAVREVRAVVDPGPGVYVLDEALLASLPIEDFFKDL